jgi:hypothetical protein
VRGAARRRHPDLDDAARRADGADEFRLRLYFGCEGLPVAAERVVVVVVVVIDERQGDAVERRHQRVIGHVAVDLCMQGGWVGFRGVNLSKVSKWLTCESLCWPFLPPHCALHTHLLCDGRHQVATQLLGRGG